MNYFVEWRAAAHERLEQIWMAAEDKRDVLRAANRIDYLLANDPRLDEAIQLGPDEGNLIVEPLAVDFVVSESERKVFITSVWMIGHLHDDEP
jgi:hypothetical protein